MQPRGLAQDLEPFSREVRGDEAEPRGVPAGARETGHHTCLHGIGHGDEDDRDRARRPLGGKRGERARGDNDVDPRAHQLARQRRQSIGLVGHALLDDEVVAHPIAERAEPFLEGGNIALRRRPKAQEADAARAIGASDAWPERRHARTERQEMPPPHSTTPLLLAPRGAEDLRTLYLGRPGAGKFTFPPARPDGHRLVGRRAPILLPPPPPSARGRQRRRRASAGSRPPRRRH